MRIFVVRCNKLCIWFVSRVVRITSFIRFLKKMLHINTPQMSFVTQSGIIKYIYSFSSPIFSRTQPSSPLRLNVPIHVWITLSWKIFNRASPKIRNIKFTEPSEFRLLWRTNHAGPFVTIIPSIEWRLDQFLESKGSKKWPRSCKFEEEGGKNVEKEKKEGEERLNGEE